MPTRLLLTLEPKALHPDGPPEHTGPAVQAFVLARLRDLDPAASAALHDARGIKPFSVTPLLEPGGEADCWHFVAGFADDDCGELVAEALDGTDLFRIGRSTFVVRDLWEHRETYPELLAATVARSGWTIRFASPTTFRTSGHGQVRRCQPWPDPALVFGSLRHRWERFSGGVGLPATTAALITENLAVAHLQIATRPYKYKMSRPADVGFVGDVEFEVAGRHVGPDGLRGIDALVRFATFTGVGDHTPMGMGYVQVVGR